MKINRIDYNFNIRNSEDVALNIGKIFNNQLYNECYKDRILKTFNLNSNENIDNIVTKVEDLYVKEQENLLNTCKLLKEKWQACSNQFLQDLSYELDLDFSNNTTQYQCYLHPLPINEICFDDKIIYLDCNIDVEEIFINLIIMITKIILLEKFEYIQGYTFNTEYTNQNKIWMFVEIAIDAIFANSNLYKLCDKPSYKYFYSLKIGGINIMEQFRELYNYISLEDFLASVYKFVNQNYNVIAKFKNYLY